MKKTVRGVGSGLPIVKDSMHSIGGHVTIEDNLKKGCVITLSCNKERHEPSRKVNAEKIIMGKTYSQSPTVQQVYCSGEKSQKHDNEKNRKKKQGEGDIPIKELYNILTQRQQEVFMILAEEGEGGPSLVAKKLKISLSTAYRDLVNLEKYGLIQTIDTSGKRKLASKGIEFLPYITG